MANDREDYSLHGGRIKSKKLLAIVYMKPPQQLKTEKDGNPRSKRSRHDVTILLRESTDNRETSMQLRKLQ